MRENTVTKASGAVRAFTCTKKKLRGRKTREMNCFESETPEVDVFFFLFEMKAKRNILSDYINFDSSHFS